MRRAVTVVVINVAVMNRQVRHLLALGLEGERLDPGQRLPAHERDEPQRADLDSHAADSRSAPGRCMIAARRQPPTATVTPPPKQARGASLGLHLLMVMGSAVVAAAFTAFALRTPALWPYLPRAPMELALKVLGAIEARTQEQVADAEFIGIWIPAFVVVLAMVHLLAAVVRRMAGR